MAGGTVTKPDSPIPSRSLEANPLSICLVLWGTNPLNQGWGQRGLSQGGKLSREFALSSEDGSGAAEREKGVQGPHPRIARALEAAYAQHSIKDKQVNTHTHNQSWAPQPDPAGLEVFHHNTRNSNSYLVCFPSSQTSQLKHLNTGSTKGCGLACCLHQAVGAGTGRGQAHSRDGYWEDPHSQACESVWGTWGSVRR